MLIHELTHAECVAALEQMHLGRLGYSLFDQPYVVPIHFSFDASRNCVYVFSTLGQKVQSMRRNPKVCLEVDDIVDKNHWTTILIVGRYREIHRESRDAEARRRAEQLFQERHEWWLPGAAKLGAKEHEHAVIFQISIDQMTGRRAMRASANV
jgi:nitroimidazol reductase NimA-like FMN-containing flavoprotein (pyridoxamine 5'-phosphate oxidase superfamily)